MLSTIFNWIINNLLQSTPIIIGLVVVIGLVAQKKTFGQIIQGFIKCIIGYQIFVMGIDAFCGVINYMQAMMAHIFDVPAMTLNSDFISGYGKYYGPVIGLGFFGHLLIERFLIPKKYRYVYMGGGHFLIRQAVLTTGIAVIVYGQTNVLTVILFGSVLSAIWYSVNPIITSRLIQDLRGDDLAGYGHQSASAVFIASFAAKIFGNKKKDTEDIQFPKGVAFLRDIGCAVTFIQILLMVGFGLACGSEKVMEIAGITTSPWLWIVLQATVFAGGFLAMNYGLRAMMGELIPAFSGISEKIIPNSRPALDVPTVFPFGSNSVLLGSSLTILFFIVYMLVFRFIGFATIFPLVASLFMSGAGVAVFANKKGGLRGVIISSLIVATIMAFGQVIAQVLGGQFYGMEYYCNVNGEADDFIILYPIIIAIGRLLFGNRAIPFGTL